MKIIDFELKGNQVKFYVGSDYCDDYYGDDWNDIPYEHNAGKVYDEFILGYFVKTFDFDDVVLEPCDGHSNSRYSKDNMKHRDVPCICVLPAKYKGEYTWYYEFEDISNKEETIKYYLGDKVPDDVEVHYIKNTNIETKYLNISFPYNTIYTIDSNIQKVIQLSVNQLAIFIEYLYCDKYGRNEDKKTSIYMEDFIKKESKKYLKKLLKDNAKLYKINVNSEEWKDFLKNIFFNPKESQKRESETNYEICYSSYDLFKIGTFKMHENYYKK